MSQPGLFDQEIILRRRDKKGDPLARLNSVVNWELFLPVIETALQKNRKSAAGRKPYEPLLMFKVLILQSLYTLSDNDAEDIVDDRATFRRFVGLENSRKAPDATTVWRFREALTKAGVIQELFDTFERHLTEQGFQAVRGQIVDASIVEIPRQRNTREENEVIRAGGTPDWPEAKRRQKDVEARWTKKNGKSFFGYKNHVSVDVKHKLIRSFSVTAASTHDGQVCEELLRENTSRDVWLDAAYGSEERRKGLSAAGYRAHIQRKGQRNHPLSEWEKQDNRRRARIRSRVEHVFGAQLARAGRVLVRTVGLARATVKIGLMNLAYNMDRLGFLMGARG